MLTQNLEVITFFFLQNKFLFTQVSNIEMPTSYEWTSGVARVNVEIKIPEAKSYLNKSDDNKYVSSTFERTGGQKRQVSVTNSVLLYSSGGGKSCRSIKIDKQSNSEKVSLKLGGPNHTDQSTTITDMVSFDNYTAVCDSSGTMTIISSPASKTTNTIKHPGDKNDFFKLTQWIGASQLYLLSLSSSNIIYEIGIKPTSSVISTGIEAVTFTAKQCDISDVTTVALLSSDQSHVKIATKTQNGWETVLTTPDLHDGDVICAIQWMGDHLVTMSGGRIVSLRFWLYTPGKELTLSLSSEYELPFNTCHATDGIISGDGGNRAIVYWPGHEVSQISIELISPGVVKFWRVDADDLLEVYVTSNSSSSSSPTNISNGEKPTHIVALFADSLCRTEWEWTQSAAAKLVPKPFNPMYIPTVIPSPDFESDNAQSRILRELGSLKASVLTMDANCRLLSVVSDRLSNVTVKDNEMTKAGLDIPKKYSSMLEESLRCTKKLNVGATADIVSTVRDNIEQAKESLVNKQTDTLMKVVKEITAEQGLQSLEEFNQNVFSKVLAPEVRGLRHLNQSTVRTLIKSEYATIQELEKKVIHLADEFQMRILTEYVTQADDLTRGIITTVDGYTNSTKQMIGEACLPINNSLRDMGLSMGWLVWNYIFIVESFVFINFLLKPNKQNRISKVILQLSTQLKKNS